jgi:hypothetical protein
MNDAVTIQADPAAQQKLTALLARLQGEMGQGAEESIRWAAYYVARSMGASMKLAPKERKFYPAKIGSQTEQAGRVQGYVWKYDANGSRRRQWIPQGVSNLAPWTRIKRRTLARSSWLWMIPDLGKTMGGAALPRMDGVATVTKQGGMNPAVILTNKLRYVLKAARTSGRQAIATAFGRGTTAGLRYIDNRIGKALSR